MRQTFYPDSEITACANYSWKMSYVSVMFLAVPTGMDEDMVNTGPCKWQNLIRAQWNFFLHLALWACKLQPRFTCPKPSRTSPKTFCGLSSGQMDSHCILASSMNIFSFHLLLQEIFLWLIPLHYFFPLSTVLTIPLQEFKFWFCSQFLRVENTSYKLLLKSSILWKKF